MPWAALLADLSAAASLLLGFWLQLPVQLGLIAVLWLQLLALLMHRPADGPVSAGLQPARLVLAAQTAPLT